MKHLTRALEALGPLDAFALEWVTAGVQERVTPARRSPHARPRRKEGMSNEVFAKLREEARDAQGEFVRAVMKEADQLLVAVRCGGRRGGRERRRVGDDGPRRSLVRR